MSEQVINYEGDLVGHRKKNWLQNKKQGFLNKYYRYKRLLAWELHKRANKIELDYSKVPAGTIPVLINNFNRLDLLKLQIEWLHSLNENIAIIVVDNASTYPPLLNFYKTLKTLNTNIQVVYLGFNSWRKGVEYLAGKLKSFPKIVITDVDLLPYPTTPTDIFTHLSMLLDKYPDYNHIGTSLEINDLPDTNPLKQKVVQFESRYWTPYTKQLNQEVFIADIDTTFAMYRNTSKILSTGPALRTDRPYTLKHVDWYMTPNNYTKEYQNYLASCKSFATWATEIKRDNLTRKVKIQESNASSNLTRL